MTRVNHWVCRWGCCPYSQKTTCKMGTVWHIIPCCPWGEGGGGGGRGKSLSVWVRLGRAKRSHAKEALHGALSSTAHGGISKSLRVWVILGRANIPQAKRGTYHASGLWVLTCLYGGIMFLWHFRLCGGMSCGLGWLFRFLEEKKYVVMLTIYILCSFMVIIFESLGWHYLIILIILLLKMILQYSIRNFPN